MLTLTQLRALVVDEADRLLGEGFEAQVRLILAQAPALGIFHVSSPGDSSSFLKESSTIIYPLKMLVI